jgi:HD-GYP domain-containing protein (c-di-GMP phosphodiesterase class II)
VPVASPAKKVRLAELIALLSLGTDLGLGQPMEHIIRQCLISLRIAERLGFDEAQRAVVYYSGLLAWVGCHTDAYEQAKWFGDDIAMKADVMEARGGLVSHLGAGKPLLERARVAIGFLTQGWRDALVMLENHYLATDELAARLGLGADVRASLRQSFERWDGRGPQRVKGKQILVASRVVQIADVVEVFHRMGGVEAAVAVARKRSGSQFDPALVKLFCQDAETFLGDLGTASSWDRVIAEEPSLQVLISDEQFEEALASIGDFAELKSPWTIGHSRAVATLAADAATAYGLSDSELLMVRRAALVQDLGRLGVSNAVWDKRASLTQAENERVRLHPYITSRMLASSAVLAPLGAIALLHHERLDGSGYPHGLRGEAISPAGRLLAAADVYQAMTQARAHRPALSAREAEAGVRAMVTAGKLDGAAVDAVLRAAGHRVRRRREWPAGLTAREVEVLRLLARGLSNKEVAHELDITPKTAGSHIEHIYDKTGASNRARASVFAMKHGLMTDG